MVEFDDRLWLFGGVSDERMEGHYRTQYQIEKENGSLLFTEYEAPLCEANSSAVWMLDRRMN